MKKGILLCAMLMVGCATEPPRNYWIEQPKDDLYLADPDVPIRSTPSHYPIIRDPLGGYFTPDGHYQSDGFGGLWAPDGTHIVPDGFGGYFSY